MHYVKVLLLKAVTLKYKQHMISKWLIQCPLRGVREFYFNNCFLKNLSNKSSSSMSLSLAVLICHFWSGSLCMTWEDISLQCFHFVFSLSEKNFYHMQSNTRNNTLISKYAERMKHKMLLSVDPYSNSFYPWKCGNLCN